jgi:plasmid stabilization system protein ParE
MGRVVWSEPALKRVRAILDYVARQSPANAAALGQRIMGAPEQLELFPLIGSIVPEFDRDDLRELLVNSFRILYVIRNDACIIVAVVHGHQDLERALTSSELHPT